jgi:hypothetical protein
MANIGAAAGVGLAKIIQDQQPYIDPIKVAIEANNYTFDLTTTINNLQEHGTINGRIIEHKNYVDAVFFITAVMYKPDTGWWILNQQQTDDYNTRPRFWFDIRADIFRNPDRVDYGVSEQYINELSNIFVEQEKKEAIQAMCQNIGSKSMEQFAIDNTVTHGTPWHEQFEPILVIPENGNNLVIEAKYGIPYFLVGKYAIGTNALTFYHNIASRWFFMTKVERDAELTRDRQLAILAAISVVEREQTERDRLAAAEREAAERDRLAREAAAEREAAEREAAEREAAERERLARETVARDAAAAVIAVSGVGQQGEDIDVVEAVAELPEVPDKQPENNITAAVIAASGVGQQLEEEELIVENRPEQNNITAAVIAASGVGQQPENEKPIVENRPKQNNITAAVISAYDNAQVAEERTRFEAERLELVQQQVVQGIENKNLQKKQQENAKEQERQMTAILASVLAEEARHADVHKEKLRVTEIQRQDEYKNQLIQTFLNTYIINFKIGEYKTIQDTIINSNRNIYALTPEIEGVQEQITQLGNQITELNINRANAGQLALARNNIKKITDAEKEIEKINGPISRIPVTNPQLIERRRYLQRSVDDYRRIYENDLRYVKTEDDINNLTNTLNLKRAKIRLINDKIQAQNDIIAAQQGILNEANKQIKQQIVNYLNNNIKTPNIIWFKINNVLKTDQIEIPADQDENFLKTFLQQAYDVDVPGYSNEQIAQGLYNLVKPPEKPRVDVATSSANKQKRVLGPRK